MQLVERNALTSRPNSDAVAPMCLKFLSYQSRGVPAQDCPFQGPHAAWSQDQRRVVTAAASAHRSAATCGTGYHLCSNVVLVPTRLPASLRASGPRFPRLPKSAQHGRSMFGWRCRGNSRCELCCTTAPSGDGVKHSKT